jgi:hypothetical protein
MPLISSRVSLEGYEPKDWLRLWEQAQRERDPGRLDAILKRMKRLLSEHKCKAMNVARNVSSAVH